MDLTRRGADPYPFAADKSSERILCHGSVCLANLLRRAERKKVWNALRPWCYHGLKESEWLRRNVYAGVLHDVAFLLIT